MANPLAALWGITGFGRQHILGFGLPMTGFLIGSYLDHLENLRMTKFRDRSALYGRQLKEGEQPSWPTTYIN